MSADQQHNLEQAQDLARAVELNRRGDGLVDQGQILQALDQFQRVLERPPNAQSADLSRERAYALLRCGDIHLLAGKKQPALQSYQQALEIRAAMAGGDPSSLAVAEGLVNAYNRMGDVLDQLGQAEQALEQYCNAEAAAQPWLEDLLSCPHLGREASYAIQRRGDIRMGQGKHGRALNLYSEAQDMAEQLSGAGIEPRDVLASDLSVSSNRVGELLVSMGQKERALEFFQKGATAVEQLCQQDPARADLARDLTVSYNRLGDISVDLGQDDEALSYYQRTVKAAEPIFQAEPHRSALAHEMSFAYQRMGDVHQNQGDPHQALEHYHSAMEIAERLYFLEPRRTDLTLNLSVTYNRMGDVHTKLGDAPTALDFYHKVLGIAEPVYEAEPHRTDLAREISFALQRKGDMHRVMKDHQAALETCLRGLALRRRLYDEEPWAFAGDLTVSYNRVAQVYLARGELLQAISFYNRTLEFYDTLGEDEPHRPALTRELMKACEQLARLHRKMGQGERAAQYRRRAKELGKDP